MPKGGNKRKEKQVSKNQKLPLLGLLMMALGTKPKYFKPAARHNPKIPASLQIKLHSGLESGRRKAV